MQSIFSIGDFPSKSFILWRYFSIKDRISCSKRCLANNVFIAKFVYIPLFHFWQMDGKKKYIYKEFVSGRPLALALLHLSSMLRWSERNILPESAEFAVELKTLHRHVSLSLSLNWFINTWERIFLPLIIRSNVSSVSRQTRWALFRSSPFGEEYGMDDWPGRISNNVNRWHLDHQRVIWFCFCLTKINMEDEAVCYLGSDKMSTWNCSALHTWSASFILWSSRVTSIFRRFFFYFHAMQ